MTTNERSGRVSVSSRAATVDEKLVDWQRAGLLTLAHADRIRAFEALDDGAEAGGSPARMTAVAEAFSYLGAALMVAALGLLVDRIWLDLTLMAQVGLTGAAAAALLAGGGLVPAAAGPTALRVRAVLWTASAFFVALTVSVSAAGNRVWDARDAVLVGAAVAAGYAAGLWWRCRHALLHIATFAGTTVTAWLIGDDLIRTDNAAALSGWIAAVGWLALTGLRVATPRLLGEVLGSGGAVVAGWVLQVTPWGHAIAMGTVAAVMIHGVRQRSVIFLGIGAVGAFVVIPTVLSDLFPGVTATSLGLLGAGAALVGVALVVLRRETATGRA